MTRRDGLDRLEGSQRWRARYTDDQGKRHTATHDTYEAAKAWREDQRSAVRHGRHIAPRDSRTTFAVFAADYLAGHGGNPSTVERVEGNLRRHIIPTFGPMALGDIKPSRINAWLRSLSELAPSTRGAVLTTLSAILFAAVDDDLIPINPATKRSVSKPRNDRRKVEPWTAEMVAGLRTHLPEQYDVLAVLGAGLGLRQGEVFGLSPADVDFLRGWVTVQRQVKVFGGNRLVFALPKGGKVRTVPLPPAVREALAEHLSAHPAVEVTLPWEVVGGKATTTPLVVSSREGKALNRNHVTATSGNPHSERLGSPTAGRTAVTRCGTSMPRRCSTAGRTSRLCRSTSDTPTPGSHCGPTPT